jgi:ParB family transcriptional regulator, chromosome partitioning protein
METTVINATEYRNVSLSLLSESKTNPRRTFEDTALQELASSIRAQGVLSPLLVRPLNERTFEIVAGARRFRAAQMAEAATVPVRIVNLTDAQAIEMSIVENLQRKDVHPLEEAQCYARLLALDEPKYSVEQIAAKCGKHPGYVLSRIRFTELAHAVVEAFSKDEIGVGHALLLAKLQPAQQEEALPHCFREDWGSGSKAKRILLPVRQLQSWIEQNVLLILKDAPFSKRDGQLVPAAGSCLDCPKRTGQNKLLFSDLAGNSDACSDPSCYGAKLDAHVKQSIAAKPKLVQITTAYGKPAEGSAILPRNQYIEIRQEKPQNKYQQAAPEYKPCKHTTEAIVAEGTDKGKLRKVCADPDCPIHHPKKQPSRADTAFKAEQEKRRREEAIANATGLRVLSAIVAAVPVRLMKLDLLFLAERILPMVDDRRLEVVTRNHGIRKAKDGDSIAKLLSAYLRKAEEGELGRLLVEMVILHSAQTHGGGKTLQEAATVYKVDTNAIAAKVKQEFAAKEKAQAAKKAVATAKPKPAKKAKAA